MDIIKLRKQLEIDEGIKHEVYLDHLGLATFGIGHLVLNSDPEYGAEVGTPVSEERVIECFESDLETVIGDCESLYEDFDDLPEEAKQIIANWNRNHPDYPILEPSIEDIFEFVARLQEKRQNP